jgi:hypothetical protein
MLTASRKTRKTRLHLNELGAKVVPAVLLQTFDLDGDGATDDIRITGDGAANKVIISENAGSTVTVKIDANGDGDVTDGADKNQTFTFTGDSLVIEAKLGGGDDAFQYLVVGNYDASARSVFADLGAGNDTFKYDTQTGDVGNHSRIALDVIGWDGSDTGDVKFDEVQNSAVSVRTDWGANRDTYNLAIGLMDGQATVDVATDLGNGTNTHDAAFGGVGKSDRGTLDVAIVGGSKTDTVTVHMNDDVGNNNKISHANIVADLRSGDDAFTVNYLAGEFYVDNMSQVSISARGGNGNDTLISQVEGTSNSPVKVHEQAIFALTLDGGAGNDIIRHTTANPNAWEILDGGIMRVRLDGGAGLDDLTCELRNTANSIATYDVAVRGGNGADKVLFNLANPGAPLKFGAAGGVIVDGGAGLDDLTDITPTFTLETGFEL